MATALHIAPGFTLPLDAVTETFGILGTRGAGKTTAAVDLAEEMWDAELPWVMIDPKGDLWGLRSSADGKGAGLALPVFGGLHGDVPLEATAGELIADLVVEQNLTCLLDVSDFSKNDRARFLVAFFDRLYRRHRADPQPRHIFMEEAHEYIPQMLGREEGRLKEAASRLVLYGRAFGIGVSVCSQRAARLHNDVLTQVSTLIAMRTLAAADRKQIEGWVTEHAVAKELLHSLPSLEPGEAWVWSPSWLHTAERIKFRQRRTFDSGATPTVHGKARRPATLAEVDLGAIKDAMAATIERSKADDPKTLRQRITVLERQIAERPTVTVEPVVETITERVEVPVLAPAILARLQEIIAPVVDFSAEITALIAIATASPPRVHTGRIMGVRGGSGAAEPIRAHHAITGPVLRPDRIARGDTTGITGPQRKLLAVLATYGPRTRTQLAMQARYSSNGGGFRNLLSSLRTSGWVTGSPDLIEITADGLAALGDYDPLPTGQALIDHWMGTLSSPQRALLAPLIDAWPAAVTKEQLADVAGYSPTGGGFRNLLSSLRTLGLVAKGDLVVLTDEFAEAIQ